MTLEYRCSNCGTLLQTTNADPLHDEIERLRAERSGKAWEVIDEKNQEIEQLRSQLEKLPCRMADGFHECPEYTTLLSDWDQRRKEIADLRSQLVKTKDALNELADLMDDVVSDCGFRVLTVGITEGDNVRLDLDNGDIVFIDLEHLVPRFEQSSG